MARLPRPRDGEGSTPLHLAAYASKGDNVKQLLEAGADPLLKNNGGKTHLIIIMVL